ncbi:MAG: dolichyl-phosphate-mannose--protein O-mannosyl transferase, partial [Leptolyngbyaceae cyanobacterium SU_3_3]|nr:dolichyl-phosphate-mannose--protein O-mannosyl transferase [Leptolyngbyaceae cyanobacterium SU_3_3]
GMGIRVVRKFRSARPPHRSESFTQTPLSRLTQLNGFYLLLTLAIVPAVFYWLLWIPHLQLNPDMTFWELQQKILSYHEQVGSGAAIHPYCSTWYSWILMIRPVAYFYQVTNSLQAPHPG